MAEIKQLLKNNQLYKIQAENGLGGNALREKLIFIENSISALNGEDCNLLKSIFIDGQTITKVAKSCFCTRQTIYNRCEKIIKVIAHVYEMQFGT